jgi:hypothetical protein
MVPWCGKVPALSRERPSGAGLLARRETGTFQGTVSTVGARMQGVGKSLRAMIILRGFEDGPAHVLARTFVGATGQAGALSRQVGALRTGSILSAGDMSFNERLVILLGGSVSVGGDIVRVAGRRLLSSVPTTGRVAALPQRTLRGLVWPQAEVRQTPGRAATGAIGAAGGIGRGLRTVLAGSVSSGGDTATLKLARAALQGAVSLSGDARRHAARSIAGLVTSRSTYLLTKGAVVSLDGAAGVAGGVRRAVGRAVTGNAAVTGDVTIGPRATHVVLTGSVGGAGQVVRAAARSFRGVVWTAGAVLRRITGESPVHIEISSLRLQLPLEAVVPSLEIAVLDVASEGSTLVPAQTLQPLDRSQSVDALVPSVGDETIGTVVLEEV